MSEKRLRSTLAVFRSYENKVAMFLTEWNDDSVSIDFFGSGTDSFSAQAERGVVFVVVADFDSDFEIRTGFISQIAELRYYKHASKVVRQLHRVGIDAHGQWRYDPARPTHYNSISFGDNVRQHLLAEKIADAQRLYFTGVSTPEPVLA